MKILNLTQHTATAEQAQAGVVEPSDKAFVVAQLNFDELPSQDDIAGRAKNLANFAKANKAQAVMIGGAPYLMSALELELLACDIKPLYAFSVRESVETTQADGTVVKTAVFKHKGFVEV